ncbi:DUF3761 domain-containing protein [Actinoallomurus iriomotensis]|uniref:DUF3761 domain-containing protein n=1 Tax=Actinoallomurus iriomotensis TaxID=478107 RepID=UPI003D7FC47C
MAGVLLTGCKSPQDASGPVPSAWPGDSASAESSPDPAPSTVTPSDPPSRTAPSSPPRRTHRVTHRPVTRRPVVRRRPTHRASAPKAPSHPSGATARCNDGTYSYSQHHQGTCSHHGGVAVWYK